MKRKIAVVIALAAMHYILALVWMNEVAMQGFASHDAGPYPATSAEQADVWLATALGFPLDFVIDAAPLQPLGDALEAATFGHGGFVLYGLNSLLWSVCLCTLATAVWRRRGQPETASAS